MNIHRRTGCHKLGPKLKSATLVLIGLNFVLTVSLLVASVQLVRRYEGCAPEMKSGMKSETREVDYKRYCFRSCERECLDRGYDLKQENNETVCCGNFNEHLYSVMSEVISKRLRWDATKATILNKVKGYITRLQHDPMAIKERPVAHVGILPNGNLTGPDSEAPRVQWEKSGERSFVSGGLIHGGDRLTVTKPGYYYVYTGLQFTVTPDAVRDVPIIAYLYRHVNGTRDSESQRKLMTSREASCRVTRGGDVTGPVSLYMAGIYLLRKGEEISVRTASQSLLQRSSSTTYLGMHLV